LAAARTKLLSVETIAERLDDRFNLLTTGDRTALPRHQTLRATIDWSYGLLPDAERLLFRRLSVFAGGFTLKAAEHVCSDDELTRAAVLGFLARLVDRSLVVVDQRREAERYHMLETIREYAREKLVEAGEEQTVRNRYLSFFIDLAEKVEPRLERADGQIWLDYLEVEIDNLRAGIEWALGSGQPEAALRLVGALRRLWVLRDHHNEAAERFKAILGRPDAQGPTAARLKALNSYFFVLWPAGKLMGGQELIEEAMALGVELGDRLNTAFALLWAGASATDRGDYSRAQTYLEQSREARRESGAASTDYWSLVYLGDLAMFQEDSKQAAAFFEQALAILREVRDDSYLGMVLRRLGQLAMIGRDLSGAQRFVRESLESNRSMRDYRGVGAALAALAALSTAQEKGARAARLFGSVDAILESIRTPLIPYDQQQYERNLQVLRQLLDRKTFATAWEEGRRLTLEQAIEYALKAKESGAR
jgi:tetratricopeptide (TPR) repeat protein